MTSAEQSAAMAHCPDCGAELRPGQTTCWLCQKESPAANPYASPAPLAEPHRTAGQFSLATLFLVMTLVAVCLGVFALQPGLGVLVLVVAVPALVRTFVAGARQKAAGHALSIGEKIVAFLASSAIMILIGVAGVIAFQIACWGSCAVVAGIQQKESEGAMWTGLILGVIVALATSGWLLWLTRPRKAKVTPP